MKIGIPGEVKQDERRVALTPACVRELVRQGHGVTVQASAGLGSGFADDAYRREGAELASSADAVFAAAQLIVKVKEPQPAEVRLLSAEHVLFTYLHLAADPALAQGLAASGATCIAYETVRDSVGGLPLLAPMSEIAGRIAALQGAHLLLAPAGTPGMLIGGVPGAGDGRVVIVGGGVAGEQAAVVASGMGAHVSVLDTSLRRLRELDARFGGRVETLYSTDQALEEAVTGANLVIGSVLIAGARAPRIIRRRHLELLARGGVLVDVAIDQGGCAETSRPTTYSDPVYETAGVLHAAVTNLPAAAPRTATLALSNATLPYVAKLAGLGVDAAIAADAGLARGVSVRDGDILDEALIAAQLVEQRF